MCKRIDLHNQKGFTLVETMIVAGLLPVIFIALFTVADLASTIFQTNNVYARLNSSAMQSLRYISREVGETSPLSDPSHMNITADGNGNSVLRFQVPVDWDGDGDAVTNELNPDTEWGVYNEVGNQGSAVQNGWARYSVTNNQLFRDVLDSGLNATGQQKMVANNVQSFVVAQNGTRLTMNLTLSATDEIGQAGGTRTQTWTFTSNTILRNAVN